MLVARSATAGVFLLLSVTVPVAAQCRPPEHPYFDFQVERAAEFIADSSRRPRPSAVRVSRSAPERVVVQFVVDTLGVPDSASFKVLLNPDPALAEATRRVFRQWRYQPALIGGCRVPQLVQTPVQP